MTLPASLAYAGGSTNPQGSEILNGQMNFHVAISKLNTDVQNVGGSIGGQSVAAGNTLDVTTMQDTNVTNKQFSTSVNIAASANVNAKNIGGDVGFVSQAACNSANVSTDPTTTAVYSNQECYAQDPSASINANLRNVGGGVSLASVAVGNTFSEDTNAPNAPVQNYQINKSSVYGTTNATIKNVGGNVGLSASAVGNSAQIVHYNIGN